MTNPIIDALTWDPDNPTKSVRALQTALMTLQDEWATKVPQLGQISRNGRVTEDDWQSLILQKGLDADRADNSYLHFDNINQEFEGKWANIFGEIQPQVSEVDSGKSERFAFHITNNYIAVSNGTRTTIMTISIDLARDAKLFLFTPFMIWDGISSTTTISLEIEVNAVNQRTVSAPAAHVDNVWEPWFFYWLTDTISAGTVTVELIFDSVSGIDDFVVGDIAPLPNVTGPTLLGVVTPYLGYIEVVYQ